MSFKCNDCEFSSEFSYNITRHHKSVHEKLRPFQCDRCEFKCSTNSDLKNPH